MMGITYFTPIINPPDTAILAMGTMKPQTIPTDPGWRIAYIGYLTLVFDHRAIDGVPAAKFLSIIREFLENPEKLEV
jgi:pyruvate dehydrogenase E2 component (dihydrolipoamide acetyltransferase)